MNSNWPTGVYSIRLTSSYSIPGLSGGNSISSTKGFTIFNENDPRYCGGSSGGGGIKKSLTDPKDSIDEELILYDEYPLSIGDIPFGFWPNPVEGVLNFNYQTKSDGKVEAVLIPINRSYIKPIKVMEEYRRAGNQFETLYLTNFENGVYLFILSYDNKEVKQKIIINNR